MKVVSEKWGHADVSTTLCIYAHVLERGVREQAATFVHRLLIRKSVRVDSRVRGIMRSTERFFSWPLARKGDLWGHMFDGGSAPEWWMVVLTAVAVVGALLAFNETRRTRLDSLRPLPFVADARYWIGGASGRATVQVRLYLGNAGPGPALDVYARVWLVAATKAEASGTAIEFHEAGERARATVAGVQPHFQGVIGLMPANSEPKIHDVRAQPHFSHIEFVEREPPALVLVRISYSDVYGRRFWEPTPRGHAIVSAKVGPPTAS